MFIFLDPERHLLKLNSFLHAYGQVTAQRALQEFLGWWHLKVDEATKLGKESPSSSDIEKSDFLLDLIELAVFDWLAKWNASHWQVERIFAKGLSGSIGQINPNPDAEHHPKRVSLREVMDLLRENALVKAGVKLGSLQFAGTEVWEQHRQFQEKFRIFEGLTVPAGSSVATRPEAGKRVISIGNRYLDLWIVLRFLGEMNGLGASSLANKLVDRFGLDQQQRNKVEIMVVEVLFQQERSRWFRWAPVAVKQAAWASEMGQQFEEDFGWESLRTALEKELR